MARAFQDHDPLKAEAKLRDFFDGGKKTADTRSIRSKKITIHLQVGAAVEATGRSLCTYTLPFLPFKMHPHLHTQYNSGQSNPFPIPAPPRAF